MSLRVVLALAACGGMLSTAIVTSEPVPVQHSEGLVHGFLALRTLDGTTIADGDLTQLARRQLVTERLTFHFRDGSLHDETTVFSQRGHFRLISDHLVQRGPSFPYPLDMSIDVGRGTVTVHYSQDGKPVEDAEHLDLPPDLSDGLILTLLKNVTAKALPTTFSFVAATPKPRLVTLTVTSAGEERFSTGGRNRSAIHYVLRVDIGGLSGVVARLTGRQPADSHVWVLGGDAPAFIKSEQPLYTGGPVWRIELVSPAWSPARDGQQP